MVFSSSLAGEPLTAAAVGFGNSTSSIALVGDTIPLLGLTTQAYSMPRDGTITSIAAYLSTIVSISLPASTATVYVQLYQSTAPDEDFDPIPGTLVVLSPTLNGVIGVGTRLTGLLTGINVPVTVGTRILMAFTVEITDGDPVATVVTGYAGGGVTIA